MSQYKVGDMLIRTVGGWHPVGHIVEVLKMSEDYYFLGGGEGRWSYGYVSRKFKLHKAASVILIGGE